MNIVDLLDRYRIPHRESGEHHHVTTKYLGVDCPYCSPHSGRYRLGIRIGTASCSCWTCGSHWLVDVLEKLTGEPFGICLDLANEVGKGPSFDSEALQPRGRLRTPRGLEPLMGPHRRYLSDRGFNSARLERLWGIKGIGLAPRLGWRIWIPITLDGRIVSWTTRAIGTKTDRRYINARPDEESVPAASLLYGADYVRGTAIVCEGPTDVWRIGPGAVAVMGMVISQSQIDLLSQIPIRVILFDSEPAAQKRATRLAETLAAIPGETEVVEVETGADVAEADQDEVDIIRERYLENG